VLVDISDRMKRAGEPPIGIETVLRAFDLTNQDEPVDRYGSLVRELILLRLIEVLPQEKVASIPETDSDQKEE
jgi:hypothetical protein